MPSSFEDIDHLLRRAGFGGTGPEIAALMPLDYADAVNAVLDVSGAPDPAAGVPNLSEGRGSWQKYVDMVWYWTERARTSPTPIVEKMVLFWHGHLCSSLQKVYDHPVMFDQLQIFRYYGLGNVPELIRLVSLHPAMLRYLDNDRNEVGDPNENFARELMELFTLGVGNYTEDDVRESARAWTGHGVNDDDNAYVFHADKHDYGSKTFMGVTQNWDGPQIITHLFQSATTQATCARFFASKVFSFFAYPVEAETTDGAESAMLNELAAAFISSNFSMLELVRAVLLRPEFRSETARLGLVRTPFDFCIAGMRRTGLPSDVAHPEWVMARMGQSPYYPPNVAGWKQNDYWISPTTTWGKRAFANNMRWRGVDAGLLADTQDRTVEDAVEQAFLLFGMYTVSEATRTAMQNFVTTVRATDRWAEQAGLLLLTPLTPEFQLA